MTIKKRIDKYEVDCEKCKNPECEACHTMSILDELKSLQTEFRELRSYYYNNSKGSKVILLDKILGDE